jgi:hypothetical protein
MRSALNIGSRWGVCERPPLWQPLPATLSAHRAARQLTLKLIP